MGSLNRSFSSPFEVAGWRVDVPGNRILRNDTRIKLEPKVMKLLTCLAARGGEVLTREELLKAVWPGLVVTDDALTGAVIKLRKAFGDDSREPRVIETIPKVGYRLLADMVGIDCPGAELGPVRSTPATPIDIAQPDVCSRRSIAVLPFTNVGGDIDQENFADGLTEDIITALASLRVVPVVARNATFSYKGQWPHPNQVALELGACYVVEGSVRRSGERLRVSAGLIDAIIGHHLWAARYDHVLTDFFDIQNDLTDQIVTSLQPEVETAELRRVAVRMRRSPGAWDCYQRGMAQLHTFTVEGNGDTRIWFQGAVTIAPD